MLFPTLDRVTNLESKDFWSMPTPGRKGRHNCDASCPFHEHEKEYVGPFFLGRDRLGGHSVAVYRRGCGRYRSRRVWRHWRETNARAGFRRDARSAIAEEETNGQEQG